MKEFEEDEFIRLQRAGKEEHQKQNYSTSLSYIKRALNIKQDHKLYRKQCKILKRMKQYDAALESINNSIKIQPQHYKAHIEKGKVLINLGRYKEAIQCYDNALQIRPTNLKIQQKKLKILRILKDELLYLQMESELQLQLIGKTIYHKKNSTTTPGSEDDDYQGLCKICLDYKGIYIGKECFHLISCEKCLSILQKECPICRTKTSFQKIFL